MDQRAHSGKSIRLVVLVILLVCVPAFGVDWPMRLYDNHRGGITAEQLTASSLRQEWVYTTARAPSPAWPESPARANRGAVSGSGMRKHLKAREDFDFCFDVAIVGNYVYFGSSTSGVVMCLDSSKAGQVVWRFLTECPVRFAPTVANEKVYFGGDDGYAYCLNASNGLVVWKENVAVTQGKEEEMIWGNEHMISVWPVRSSILVDDGYVYWAAGIFPREGMYFCKRNAETGSTTGGWTQTGALTFPAQGYLLATANEIYVPHGISAPDRHKKSDGSFITRVWAGYHDGGCWAILTPDEKNLWAGRSWSNNDLNKLDTGKIYPSRPRKEYLAQIPEGNYLIADGTYAYYNTDTTIVKILRSDVSTQWSKSYSYKYSLIKAGTHVYAGGDGEIAAFDESNGNRVWTAAVDGKTYGLAVANGKLYASTDQGSVYCFSAP